jgi:single-stranded DNA-binding protein
MLSKGDGVICIGELHQRQYQGKDGTTKYSVDLENASWHFPPKSANSGQSRGGGGGYSSQSNNQSSNNQSESGGGYDESIPF